MTAAEQQPDAGKDAEKKAEGPFFRVVRGNPTAVEVGILSAVLATAQGNAVHEGEFPTGIKDDWGSYDDRLRPPFGYNPTSFLNRRQY
ncbi:MAG: acyl-CoA carboxylase subunit epsilon [Dietzia sp.]